MTAAPPEDLDALVAHITGRLVDAADSRRGPWRTPVLATVATNGAPAARTVVIRSVDPQARRVEIFTDRRSAKVAEIAADPRAALTFWDETAGEQLRIDASIRQVEDDDLKTARWEAIGPAGRALYGDGPGAPNPELFVVLESVWSAWDWLWIGGTPHRRARFVWSGSEADDAAWIDP